MDSTGQALLYDPPKIDKKYDLGVHERDLKNLYKTGDVNILIRDFKLQHDRNNRKTTSRGGGYTNPAFAPNHFNRDKERRSQARIIKGMLTTEGNRILQAN